MRKTTSRFKGLTPPQAQLLGYLKKYCEEEKRSPSYREMMLAMGLGSVAPIQSRIRCLERHGLIRRLPGARGIIPVSTGRG
jgi:SOS-response transcriptional repressor LexA